MRNMSFSLTTEQIRAGTKTVTRRTGWVFAKVGDKYNPVVKGQGLKKGEKVDRIRGPLRVVRVQRQWVGCIGCEENGTAKEGLPEMAPLDFVIMFCKANKCNLATLVTRIEFEYTDKESK